MSRGAAMIISGFSFLQSNMKRINVALSEAIEGGHLIEPNGNYWGVFARDQNRYFVGPYIALGTVEPVMMLYASAHMDDWSLERVVFEFLRSHRVSRDMSELAELLRRFGAEIARLGPDDAVARAQIQPRRKAQLRRVKNHE